MQTIQVLGLILGIVVMVVGAYKGLKALPLTLFSAVVIIITNGMPLWESIADTYFTGYLNFFKSYVLLFIFSSFYAKIMDITGASVSIANQCIRWFGEKRAMLIVIITCLILTYGGISVFVVLFALVPIIFKLFKEADIDRSLALGAFGVGTCTLSMSALPGTPSVQNTVPTTYLGTNLMAAPILGIIASILLFALGYAYMMWQEKRHRVQGIHFQFPANFDTTVYDADQSELPSALASFLPLVVLVVMIITLSKVFPSAVMLTVVAMSVASILAIGLNWNRMKGRMKSVVNDGFTDGVGAIGNVCAVAGFGTVVSASVGYATLVNMILSMNVNPYITGTLGTALLCGVSGSASGGLNIALNSLGEQLLASGANPQLLHRLMAVASGTFDSLPHASGLFIFMPLLYTNHKESYFHLFITTAIIPLIVTIICTAGVIMMGL